MRLKSIVAFFVTASGAVALCRGKVVMSYLGKVEMSY